MVVSRDAIGAEVAALEIVHLELYRRSSSPSMSVTELDDAMVVRSAAPSPIFNGVIAPRLPEEGWQERVTELVEEHVERGMPFQWWTGPLSHDDRAEDLLASLGLVSSGGAPGMYLDLDGFELPSKASGLEVRVCDDADTWSAALDTLIAGFGMDPSLAAPFAEILAAFSPDDSTTIHVLDHGVPVGGGSVVYANGMAGLYNIAVPESARGRGVGRAVTLELLRLALSAGCGGAMLHASVMGFPVYERIGFEEVGRVHMRVWTPPTTT